LPDEDEIEHDRVEDVLLVEALMGWDGDRCECDECDCPRFRDAADDVRCGDCRVGRHWTDAGGSRP
jgi:hypothetical protein